MGDNLDFSQAVTVHACRHNIMTMAIGMFKKNFSARNDNSVKRFLYMIEKSIIQKIFSIQVFFIL